METTAAQASPVGGIIGLIIFLAICIFLIVAYWKVYTKAGQPGWGCLIPIYNLYLMLKIANKPGWWLILILLVPIANIVCLIIMLAAVANNFGKGTGFTVGLVLLPIIFFPILGFGSAKYEPKTA